MVDRSSIHTPDPDPDKTESEGVAAPLLQKEEVPETNINDPPVIGVHPPSTPASTKEQNNSPSVQGPRRRPRSQQSSRSGSGSGSGSASDLELDEMRHADPAYSAANGRSSEETVKLDTSRGGWTDGIFERDDPEDDLDHDSKEARRLGSKQFIEKTAINVTLIAAWYILSISMSVVCQAPSNSLYLRAATDLRLSTTNGCSRPARTSTFITPSSRPPST